MKKFLSKYNIDEALEYLRRELKRRENIDNEEVYWVNLQGKEINIKNCSEMPNSYLKNIIDKLERVKFYLGDNYSNI